MAIESIDIPLGTPLIPFTLKDPLGKSFSAGSLYGEKGFLVIFTCNHCPYAQAVWPRTIRLAEYAKPLGITTAGINPNLHPDYPEDAPDEMKKKIDEWGITFPYLIDETQEIARAYKAQCTPDIFLFDKERKLVYHGRVDDNWKDESKVTQQELKAAMDAVAAGKPVSGRQLPTIGCSIKWRLS